MPTAFRREEVLLGTELAVPPCFRGANAISLVQPDLDVGVFRGSSQGAGDKFSRARTTAQLLHIPLQCKVQQDVVRWQQGIC